MLAGLSRKYKPHATAQTKLITPRITNDPRQLSATISHATSGGVSALPRRAQECVMPCAKPRLPFRSPVAHRARGRRKRSAFAKAEQHAREKHRRKATGKSSQHRGASPDYRGDRQRPARAEAVAHPSADDLKDQVGICESRKNQTHLRIDKMQFFLESGGAVLTLTRSMYVMPYITQINTKTVVVEENASRLGAIGQIQLACGPAADHSRASQTQRRVIAPRRQVPASGPQGSAS